AYEGLKDTVNTRIRPLAPAEAATLTGQLDEAIAAQESVRDRLRAASDSDSPERPAFSSFDRASSAMEDVRNSGIRDQVSEPAQRLRAIATNTVLTEGAMQLNTAPVAGASAAHNDVGATPDADGASLHDLHDQINTPSRPGDLSRIAAIAGDYPEAFAQAIDA